MFGETYVIGSENIRIHPSERYRIPCGFIFSPSGEQIYFFSVFTVEFAGYVWTVAVSGRTKSIRIRVDGALVMHLDSDSLHRD